MQQLESQTDAPGGVALRPALPADEPFLRQVYASTREEELAAAGWDVATGAQFVEMQFRAMRQGYAQSFPDAAWTIISLAGEAAGYLVITRTREEIRIVDLALLPAHRSRGLGGALVRGLQAEAAAAGQPLRLRILKGGRSAHLCQRLGFRCFEESGFHHHWEWRAPVSA